MFQDNENFEFVQGEKNEESLKFFNDFIEEETDLNFHHYNKKLIHKIKLQANLQVSFSRLKALTN